MSDAPKGPCRPLHLLEAALLVAFLDVHEALAEHIADAGPDAVPAGVLAVHRRAVAAKTVWEAAVAGQSGVA